MGQSLDPRVAFSEGIATAFGAIVHGSPVAVSTSGSAQNSGFTNIVDVAPTADDRGYWSERSSQFLVYRLWDNRDGKANSGVFDRLYTVVALDLPKSPALISAHSLAAWYNQRYGAAAESLQTLWSSTLASPFDALCKGACSASGDVADPWDVDGDYGKAFASTRHYPTGGSQSFAADFWNLFPLLTVGTRKANAHDQLLPGGYSKPLNKLGTNRLYRFVGMGNPVELSITNLQGAACTSDVLDLYVFSRPGW